MSCLEDVYKDNQLLHKLIHRSSGLITKPSTVKNKDGKKDEKKEIIIEGNNSCLPRPITFIEFIHIYAKFHMLLGFMMIMAFIIRCISLCARMFIDYLHKRPLHI